MINKYCNSILVFHEVICCLNLSTSSIIVSVSSPAEKPNYLLNNMVFVIYIYKASNALTFLFKKKNMLGQRWGSS